MNKKKKFDWYGVIRVLTSILIALVIARSSYLQWPTIR